QGTQTVLVDGDADVMLATEPKWDLFNFAYDNVHINYTSQYFAVGQNGATFRWTGSQWVPISSTVGVHLSAVADVSPYEAYAVGNNGTTIRYAQGSWTEIPSPTNRHLNSVSMV